MSNNETDETAPHARWSDSARDAEPVLGRRGLQRVGWVLLAVLLVALLVTLPPLLNVNRYQKRVAQAIGSSIGRPVHFDDIHLHLLPLPGLTIQNFVVEEDPAFGTEPAMRANVVEARLRLLSLWRRRVEVSRIQLQSPSINLVRRADGRWNLQGVVAQAGSLQSAPTAQKGAGQQPRFPYVEATDARINIRMGETKLPWSLLDARLALWLPEQNEWRVRLRGRPLRTDTDVSDVGDLELEGSLGRGAAGVAEEPLAIAAKWSSTPLGEAAKLFVGRDTGFRGAASAEMEVRGTLSRMQVSTDLHLHNLRRAEFVPRLPMSLDAHCEAEAMGVAHQLHAVRCAVPTAAAGGLLEGVFHSREEALRSAPDVLSITAEVPEVADPSTATASATLGRGAPGYFLNWLRVFSSRVPDRAEATGGVSLQASWNSAETPGTWSVRAACQCRLSPAMQQVASASGGLGNDAALGAGSPQIAASNQPWLLLVHGAGSTARGSAAPTDAPEARVLMVEAGRLLTTPAASDVSDGKAVDGIASTAPEATGSAGLNAAAEPDAVEPPIDEATSVRGDIGSAGSALRYASAAVARYAGLLLPPLVDDLPAVTPPGAAVQSTRQWGKPQQWSATVVPAAPSAPRHKRRHR